MADEGARWRSTPPRQSAYRTNLLFHVSDGHGRHGLTPFHAAGETWETVHDALHAAGDFGGRDPHDH